MCTAKDGTGKGGYLLRKREGEVADEAELFRRESLRDGLSKKDIDSLLELFVEGGKLEEIMFLI